MQTFVKTKQNEKSPQPYNESIFCSNANKHSEFSLNPSCLYTNQEYPIDDSCYWNTSELLVDLEFHSNTTGNDGPAVDFYTMIRLVENLCGNLFGPLGNLHWSVPGINARCTVL